MIETIQGIINNVLEYITNWFHHTICKSKCGQNNECSCENMGLSSSSSGSEEINQITEI